MVALEETHQLVMHMVDMVVEQEHTLITLVEVLVEDILVELEEDYLLVPVIG